MSEPWLLPRQLHVQVLAGFVDRRQVESHLRRFIAVPGLAGGRRREGDFPGECPRSVDARRVCTATRSPPKVVTARPASDVSANAISVTLCTVSASSPNSAVNAPHAPDAFEIRGFGIRIVSERRPRGLRF